MAKEPITDAEIEATETFSALTLKAVRDEDYRVGNSIQSGLKSAANEHFIFGRNEPAVQNYHQSIEQFMEMGNHQWERPKKDSGGH